MIHQLRERGVRFHGVACQPSTTFFHSRLHSSLLFFPAFLPRFRGKENPRPVRRECAIGFAGAKVNVKGLRFRLAEQTSAQRVFELFLSFYVNIDACMFVHLCNCVLFQKLFQAKFFSMDHLSQNSDFILKLANII